MNKSNIKKCAKCGQKVFPYCTNLECLKWREEVARTAIKDCFATLGTLAERLAQKNEAGTKEDYKEIKKVREKITKLSKERKWSCPLIKTDIENLKKSCSDLINEYISPKDKEMGDSKRGLVIHAPCCTPRNIKLEANDSEQYYYCDYCWETESPKFLQSLKSYHLDKLNKKMLDNGISSFELNSSNYQSMLTVPDFLLTQEGIQETYQKVEKDLEESLKKKGINISQQNDSSINDHINNNNSISIEREREREREQIQSQQAQLRSQIMQLEQNPTNLQNQAELAAKKQQLKDLENKQKELISSLPIDDVNSQIAILEREIQVLTQKPTRNQTEEALLAEKKQQLAELLKKQSNTTNNSESSADKVALYYGIGIVGVFLIGLVLILVKKSKKNKKY